MILKRLVLLIAFIWGSAAAQAATLDNVTPVVGAPTIFDPMATVTASSFGVSYVGSLFAASSTLDPILILGANFNVIPDTFFALAPGTPPSPLLTGTTLDVAEGPGIIQALFATTGGSLAPAYGSLFRLTLSSSLFTGSTLDTGSPGVVTEALALVEAVEAVNVIPLPAGFWLILSGFGGLLMLRRSTKSATA